MRVIKKLLTISMITLLLFSLTACSKTPKEELKEGYSNLADTKIFQVSSNANIELEIDGLPPEEQQMLDMFNTLNVKADTIVDTEKRPIGDKCYFWR